MCHWWNALLLFLILINQKVNAAKLLFASSLVTCTEFSQISAETFNVSFNPETNYLEYHFDLTTQIDDYVIAEVDVFAYGFKALTQQFDLCKTNYRQVCPIHPGHIQIESSIYIPRTFTNQVPGIAYTVPDIDAYLRIKVYNRNYEELACLLIFFENGKTVAHNSVKWLTAVIAGLGLLISTMLITFGETIASAHISANTVSLFLYFQSVVIVSLEHTQRTPPIAAAWSENLLWSIGLIKCEFIQKIVNWYIEATGGSVHEYLTTHAKSILTQRNLDFNSKRSEDTLFGGYDTLILRGINRMAYRIGIEIESVVATGFTYFLIFGAFLILIMTAVKCVSELLIRMKLLRGDRFWELRHHWPSVIKGILMTYVYIGFSQISLLSFWEFIRRDSPAILLFACVLLVLTLALMLATAIRVVKLGEKSKKLYGTPVALLFGDEKTFHKYGFFHSLFREKYYWWNIVKLTYIFCRCVVIGAAQSSGRTQAILIFLFDLVYLALLCTTLPYFNFQTNILNVFISSVTLLNSFLFLFFSGLFGQNYNVSAVMGWIFFVLNASFSLSLLIMILCFTGICMMSKETKKKIVMSPKDDRILYVTDKYRLKSKKQNKRSNFIPASTEVFEDIEIISVPLDEYRASENRKRG